jgi:hypothetical protein
MAITLEANYSKKLGLPQYSSHQYSVTVRTEVSDLSQVDDESSRLYRQLQNAVDRDIQDSGFLPGSDDLPPVAPFERQPRVRTTAASEQWNCSPKQQGLIEKLMREHKISREDVEKLALFRFKTDLTALNKMQASGLIDELIDTYSKRKGARS